MFRSNLIEFLEWIIAILNICSIGILIVGIVLVLFKLFDWSHVKKNYAERNTRNADTRKLLASYILLSLEVLVVADISYQADLDRYFEACTYYYHSNSHFLFLESGNRRQRKTKKRRGRMTTELMQFLLPYFEKLVLGLDIFAICLLVWGVCLSIKDFLKYLFVHTKVQSDRVSENNAIKKMLGGYILLSLEILVCEPDVYQEIVTEMGIFNK